MSGRGVVKKLEKLSNHFETRIVFHLSSGIIGFKFTLSLCSEGCSPNQPFPYLQVEIPFSIFLSYIFSKKYLFEPSVFKIYKMWPFTCKPQLVNGHLLQIRKVAIHLPRFAVQWQWPFTCKPQQVNGHFFQNPKSGLSPAKVCRFMTWDT